MAINNNTIFTLWVEGKLDDLTITSIKSWINLGYSIELFMYGAPEESDWLLFKDAVQFLDASQVVEKPDCGFYAEMADNFRFNKLLKEGGTWIDSDLILLKRLPEEQEIIISSERCKKFGAYSPKGRDKTPNIGVIRFPAKHPLMVHSVKICKKRIANGIKENNNSNNALMKIFQDKIYKHKELYWDLVSEPDVYCPINWSYSKELYTSDDTYIIPKFGTGAGFKFGMEQKTLSWILDNSTGIHLWRNLFHTRNYRKLITENCVYNQLKQMVESRYKSRLLM